MLAGKEMFDEDVQDEFSHSSIPSSDTYEEEDKDDAPFLGNQYVVLAGYGNLDSDDQKEVDFICRDKEERNFAQEGSLQTYYP